MDRRVVVVVAILAVLAGCSTTADGGAGGGATPTATAGGGETTGAPLVPGGVDPVRMTVTRVVDGDTVQVTFDNGIEDTVRLLGVDTPETRSENSPEEFEGVPDTEAGRACLDRFGDRATEFATERLDGREITFYADPEADRRGSFGRLLGYVVVDGENLNYRLVRDGHARVFDSRFSLSAAFYDAESTAMASGRGVWACADDTDAGAGTSGGTDAATPDGGSVDGRLAVVDINADAAGNDNENLNDEYVVLGNVGEAPLDLSGWTVTEGAGREYVVPDGTTLAPGDRLTLHTGSGTDTDTDLYWGQSSAVWNNGGDTVTVRDAGGTVVAERSY